jgi:Ca2+-binding RTX toxin-like protein
VTPGAQFHFNAFDLTVLGFEALRVLVDGVEPGTVDHPVDAVDDAYSVSENGTVSGQVLTNDSVPDAPPGVTLVSGPPAGALTLNPDGSFSFDPNFAYDFLATGESTVVSFSYQATDADGDNDTASVAITINGENDAPFFFGGITSGAIAEDGFTSAIGSISFLDVDLSDAHTRSILPAGPDYLGSLSASITNDSTGDGSGSVSWSFLVDNAVLQALGSFDVLTQTYTITIDDGHGGLLSQDVVITIAGEDELITGTEETDNITGSDAHERIEGLGGDDFLYGFGGRDTLEGADGNDYLQGDFADAAFGLADVLNGGDGDDTLFGGGGDDTLNGGDGNDTFLNVGFNGGTSLIQADVVDAGAGDDRVEMQRNNSLLTLGTGIDTIVYTYAGGLGLPVVTDFAGGAGGDVLDFTTLVNAFVGWDGATNPFDPAAGFLQLVQNGSAVELMFDFDGAGIDFAAEAILTFENALVGAFTADNFAPGYSPDGAAPPATTITGSGADETIDGTIGNDTIDALGGFDVVHAGTGHDIVDGGDDNDQLFGEAGNDGIAGSGGNDTLDGGLGNDSMDGGDGNDFLYGSDGSDTLTGGIGDDYLQGDFADPVFGLADVLDGGDGNDTLFGGGGDDTLTGGAGNDTFNDVGHSGGGAVVQSDTVDAGDGEDTVWMQRNASTLTLGAGSDLVIYTYAGGTGFAVVTDFAAGPGGDRVDFTALMDSFVGWDGATNPFAPASGFLQLAQNGGAVDLMLDLDGTGTGFAPETILSFSGTNLAGFTADNFVPGYSPDGAAPADTTMTGSGADETLTGTPGADTIDAQGGFDVVRGGPGHDVIDGGGDNDQLFGEAGNDDMSGGTGNDHLDGGSGDDQLQGGDGDDLMYGLGGSDTLEGGAGNDYLQGDFADPGFGANDVLDGGADDDTLFAGGGDDRLTGGTGTDDLTGGGGADRFVFATPGDGFDTIQDFAQGADAIEIAVAGFGGGLTAGGPAIVVNAASAGAAFDGSGGGYFIFDDAGADLGTLYWDGSGGSGSDAVALAQIASVASLQASDLVLV